MAAPSSLRGLWYGSGWAREWALLPLQHQLENQPPAGRWASSFCSQAPSHLLLTPRVHMCLYACVCAVCVHALGVCVTWVRTCVPGEVCTCVCVDVCICVLCEAQACLLRTAESSGLPHSPLLCQL